MIVFVAAFAWRVECSVIKVPTFTIHLLPLVLAKKKDGWIVQSEQLWNFQIELWSHNLRCFYFICRAVATQGADEKNENQIEWSDYISVIFLNALQLLFDSLLFFLLLFKVRSDGDNILFIHNSPLCWFLSRIWPAIRDNCVATSYEGSKYFPNAFNVDFKNEDRGSCFISHFWGKRFK